MVLLFIGSLEPKTLSSPKYVGKDGTPFPKGPILLIVLFGCYLFMLILPFHAQSMIDYLLCWFPLKELLFFIFKCFKGYSSKGGKGDKIANGGKTPAKEPQPLELNIELGGYLDVYFWFTGIYSLFCWDNENLASLCVWMFHLLIL